MLVTIVGKYLALVKVTSWDNTQVACQICEATSRGEA